MSVKYIYIKPKSRPWKKKENFCGRVIRDKKEKTSETIEVNDVYHLNL